MNKSRYDLAIACRIYPKASANRSPIFPDDKYKLVELCMKSLKASLIGLRVKLWAILNACPPEYDELIRGIWGTEDLVLCHYPGVPPSVTMNEAIRILREQNDANTVFLACDDYFYLPGQASLALDFLNKTPDADFVSLYDCVDLYNTDLHKLKCEVKIHAGRRWISRLATTDTFMTRRSALLELDSFFSRLKNDFPKGHSPDLAMWMALTKKRVFNPFKFIHWIFTRRLFWSGSIALAWWHCWRQIALGRKYTLWIPQPSISTHMVAGLEAPEINWSLEFQKHVNCEIKKS